MSPSTTCWHIPCMIVLLIGLLHLPQHALAATALLPEVGDTRAAASVAQHAAASAPAPARVIGTTPESGHQVVVEGLSIDNVAAEAAARPAAQLPSDYAIQGVIDPQSPLFSEEPGVLVPLAQARAPVGDWLAAVEAAGPSTPLSDPMLVGTVFVPRDEAFEAVYPELHRAKLQGKAAGDAFAALNVSTASLALQLNCLTIPGAAVKLDELWPGRLLRTAGLGAIKVISNRADQPAQLQHQPSGLQFSITEADLQSGNAVAHVVDVLLPAALLSSVAPSPTSLDNTLQYRSVMAALLDPVWHLQAFAQLVKTAALGGLMDSSRDAFTLFAPDDRAMSTLMASLPVATRQQLLTNATLADAFVSSHLVLGAGLGSKALEALLPAGQLKTPQGSVAVGSASDHHQPPSVQLPSGAVALIEAGRSSQHAPPSGSGPQQPAGAASAADAGTMPAQEQLTAAAAAPDADAGADVHAADSAADADVGADAHAADSAALLDPAGAAASGEAGPGRAGAAGGALGRRFTVAGAEVVSGDMVGGKAVLHVVDRVLISPGLSRELGLLPSSGYHLLDTPQPTAATSGVQGLSAAGFAGWVLPTAVAMVLCLL